MTQYSQIKLVYIIWTLVFQTVYKKDIQIGKIYYYTEWSAQIPGTLQNVSNLVDF